MDQRIAFARSKDKTTIAYALSGEGPPLVRADTWLTHVHHDWESPIWAHWLRFMSERHTLVRYDPRGCGLAQTDVRDITFDDWVADLRWNPLRASFVSRSVGKRKRLKNTNESADTAPAAAPDTTAGGEPPEVLGWPFIERRKVDRRASDRRRQASRADPLRAPESGVCTDRELQIVRLLTQGMTNKQIANKLGIAEDTVKKHLQHVYKKLGVRRRALLIIDRVSPKRPRRNPG